MTSEPFEGERHSSDYYFPPYIPLARLSHLSANELVQQGEKKHYHMYYTMNGSILFSDGAKEHKASPGDLLLCKPNQNWSIRSSNRDPIVYVTIGFHFGSSGFPLDCLVKEGYLGNYYNQPVEKAIQKLVLHHTKQGLQNRILCQQLLMQIIHNLCRSNSHESNDTHASQKVISKMIMVKNYLTDHYNENIKIKDLEEISGLSKNYISAQFKQVFHMQPMQYVIWLRIEKAKELALQTDLSFSEIADRVGYSDIHTFSRMFKRKTGYSLSQFCSSFHRSKIRS